MTTQNNAQALKPLVTHLYAYGDLVKKYGFREISNEQLFEGINIHIRIPMREKKKMIKEMERMGLIIRLNQRSYRILFKKGKVLTDEYGSPMW